MIALRPVSGALGLKIVESAAPELVAELVPPLVADGLVSGLALLYKQVLTPLMIPLLCAVLNSSQMVELLLVV